METYSISAFVTLCTCLFTFYLAFNVGSMRRKHKANVLKTTKDEEVLIANRVHMNTIENLVVYLPILWIATIYGPTKIAGIVGAVWFLSRILYAFMYFKNPNKREKPFIIGVLCLVITALLAFYGLVF